MSGMTFEVSAEMKSFFSKAPEKALMAGAGQLYKEANAIMSDSKENYVPVDTGVLRESGTVELPEVTRDQASVTLGYGGAASDYALTQHEDLTLNHPNGGSAKYLEIPFNQAAGKPGLKKRILAAISRAVGGR